MLEKDQDQILVHNEADDALNGEQLSEPATADEQLAATEGAQDSGEMQDGADNNEAAGEPDGSEAGAELSDDADMELSENEEETVEPVNQKSVWQSIQEDDYKRFGVDPKKDKKVEKEKKPPLHKLLNARYLKTSVEKYGFTFDAKKFYFFVLAMLAGAVVVGWMFQLDWYFLVIIGLVGFLCAPTVFMASLEGMFAAKQFHDVSDYMEQLLYSFRRKRKILTSLEDVYIAFEDDNGPMKDLVAQAIEYIRTADTEGDIHREAFDIIEAEYNNDRLRSAHNFLIAVENNGGAVEQSLDLLLDERAMWDERVHTFQKEKGAIKRNVTISIIMSLVLCFAILYIFSVESLESLAIPKNFLVQITSAFVIVSNLLLYVKLTNRFTKSWLKRDDKQSDYSILRDYFYVENYDPAKEKRLSIILTAATSLIWIYGLWKDMMLVTIVGAVISLFCMFSSQISISLAKKSTTKEIQKAFPQWLMELALLLQNDNVQVSIAKTLDSAPVVLRPELELLVERFEESPHSLKPYSEFLKKYDLSDIKSTMKMLYSVSASGTVNIEEQITDLIKKQNNLMDKAEKISYADQLAGITTINLVPMLFCILKSVVDMGVLVLSLFSLMSI